jgi:ABC-type transporter Mla subunit MlaD
MAATARTVSYRRAPRASEDQARFLARWLKVWVALLTVVTLVVVVFLIFITNSLASINGNLATANAAVTGAGGDVKTLPDQVQNVNASLSGIDPALKPIPGQADQIIAALSSIDSKLRTTDGSLSTIDSNLSTVLGQAGSIRGLLVDADNPGDRLGVQNIHQRVAVANGVGTPGPGLGSGSGPGQGTGPFGANPHSLSAAKADAGNILAGLLDTNRNLTSACNKLPAILGPC